MPPSKHSLTSAPVPAASNDASGISLPLGQDASTEVHDEELLPVVMFRLLNDILARGASPIEAIKAVGAMPSMSVGEAKAIVHSLLSPHERAAAERLWDAARLRSKTMRFGLDVAQQRMSWDELVRRVQLAEELGFDGVWGYDHFQPMYGEGPGEAFDGMTFLAALASLTTRVRLGLLVAGVTYRLPSVFAAQAMTIDHASHGRLELGLGAAWFEKEHRELGIPFPTTADRLDLLEDTLEILTRLFTGQVVSYEGHLVSLRDARLLPVPVQQPHPPIWIGGSGPRRTLPLVAKFADVWHTWGTPSSTREANTRVDEFAASAGRDPSSIKRASSLSVDDLETARRQASAWRDANYDYLVCGWPGAGASQVERFAREVMPAFA